MFHNSIWRAKPTIAPPRGDGTGVTSKIGFHAFFCKHWAPFFEVKQRLAPFSGILPRFSTNQNIAARLRHHWKGTSLFSLVGRYPYEGERL